MLTLLSAGFAAAQSVEPVTSTSTAKDTTKIILGTTKVLIVGAQDVNKTASDSAETLSPSELKESLTFWTGIDLGVNTLFNAGGTNTAPEGAEWLDLDESRSLSWSVNFYQEKIKLIGNHVGVLTGAGLTYNSYGIKTNARVLSNSDSTYANVVPDSLYRFSKNKLRATYLRVPLMIEFNTSNDPDRTVHLAVGAIGGLRIGSITKQHYEIDGQNYRDRVKSDFNLSPFTLDAAVRLGYKDFTLWANYGLTPLFEKDKGPEVYALSVGVTILPF